MTSVTIFEECTCRQGRHNGVELKTVFPQSMHFLCDIQTYFWESVSGPIRSMIIFLGFLLFLASAVTSWSMLSSSSSSVEVEEEEDEDDEEDEADFLRFFRGDGMTSRLSMEVNVSVSVSIFCARFEIKSIISWRLASSAAFCRLASRVSSAFLLSAS